MNEPTKRVTVQILEKDFQVACKPNEKEALLIAAKELDTRMRKVRNSGAIVGIDRIAVMVALNLCHELQQSLAAQQTLAVQHSQEAQHTQEELLKKYTPNEKLTHLAEKLERALADV